MSVHPNSPRKRFEYIARTLGEKHPDVVLDTFMVLADTVGIEHPFRRFDFAEVWHIAATQPLQDRNKRRVELWDQGEIPPFAVTGAAIRSTTRPKERLSEALSELSPEEAPEMFRGRDSDALWPWVANQLVKEKKKGQRAGDVWPYIQWLDWLDGKGPALALWQKTERINLSQHTLESAAEALEDFEIVADLEQGEVVYTFADGWTVQELESRHLEDEGEVMQHCVGDYCGVVEDGTTEIYSLRDPNGQPHVTMEYHPATERFSQIMGKQNEEPIDAYKVRVEEFIDKGTLPVRPDGALTLEEAAMAQAWGANAAESDWDRNREDWLEGHEHGVLAEWERREHPYASEDLIRDLFEYYPRGRQRTYEFPRFAFGDDATFEMIEDQDDIVALLEKQAEAAYKEQWAELAQDDRDQLDYAIDDVVKKLEDHDVDYSLGSAKAAVGAEVDAALDRRLGPHKVSGRDQVYVLAMALNRLDVDDDEVEETG